MWQELLKGSPSTVNKMSFSFLNLELVVRKPANATPSYFIKVNNSAFSCCDLLPVTAPTIIIDPEANSSQELVLASFDFASFRKSQAS